MGDRDRKRGPDSDHGPRKEMRSGTIIKMLCPFYSAGAIIGDGGKEIKSIKENMGINIQVSKKEVRFPGTDERVVTLQGECETIKKVVKHIQDLIRNDKPPPSAKSVDVEGNEKRKRALKLVVADTSAGRIIGKGGETIKALKERYAVAVNTSKKGDTPPGLDERIVSVEGDHDEVDNCVQEMVETICGDRQARMQWFIDYNNIGGGYDDGYGRGGSGGGYDSGRSSYGGYGGSSGGYGGYGGGSRSSYSSGGYGGGGYGGYGDSYGSRSYDDRGGYGGYGAAQEGYNAPGRYGSGGYGRR